MKSNRTARLLIGGVVIAMLPMNSAVAATSAAPKPAHKVGICHRTADDKKPYVFEIVDKNSEKYQGHLAHRNNPKDWKHGRRDYIDGLDGSIKSLADCPNKGKPTSGPPPSTIPPGTLGPGQKPIKIKGRIHRPLKRICRLATPNAHC